MTDDEPGAQEAGAPDEPRAREADPPPVDVAALYGDLTRPILVIVNAEIRELAEAWNILMQIPDAAGEHRADHLDSAVTHLRRAREVLRAGVDCARC